MKVKIYLGISEKFTFTSYLSALKRDWFTLSAHTLVVELAHVRGLH